MRPDGLMDETQPTRRSHRAAALACKEKLRKVAAPSRRYHAINYESAASQQGLLFDLPQGVIEGILHEAGPHSRQVCKALAHLYGPLPSLAPRGLARVSDLSALRRHRRLAALDLRHVAALLTEHSLKGICKALPHLQNLRTGTQRTRACSIKPPALAAALAMLPSLTSLHLPSCSGIDHLALDAISALTALRELTLPTTTLSSAPVEDLAKLGACTHLSKLAFQDPLYNWSWLTLASVARCAVALPELVSLTLDAHQVDALPAQLQELQRLTQLTELRLRGVCSSEATPTSQTLQMIGTMVNLRSLDIKLVERDRWSDAEGGWLSRLSLLTSLGVRFAFDSDDDDADDYEGSGAFDEVVSAVPQLPALRELRLSSDCEDPLGDMDDDVSDAAFERLASARTSLEVLELRQLNLSGNYMEVVQQLTGLTSVGFRRCDGMSAFGGLAALTALRELTYDRLDECTLGCGDLEGLSNLHTLALRGNFMDRAYLTRLVAALPQLRVLDISTNSDIGSGVSALRGLSSLEVVDLSDTVEVGVLVRHLRAPKSLRQCFVGAWLQQEERQRVRNLLGTGVEVREDRWQPEEWVRLH